MYAARMHAFRAAMESRDLDAVLALLADDVVLDSPIAFRPYTGKPVVGAVLAAVGEVFEDAAYERELRSEDGRDTALMLRAHMGGTQVQACDFVHEREDGLIDRITVMVRPLSAAIELRDRMAALLEDRAA